MRLAAFEKLLLTLPHATDAPTLHTSSPPTSLFVERNSKSNFQPILED